MYLLSHQFYMLTPSEFPFGFKGNFKVPHSSKIGVPRLISDIAFYLIKEQIIKYAKSG